MMIINYIIIPFAIMLYYTAPDNYNFYYVVILTALYLLESVDLLKEDFREKKYLSFHSVFLFSFFLTTFAFPLFVLNSNSAYNAFANISSVVFSYVSFNSITKAVALSLIAISFYILGVKYAKRKKSFSERKMKMIEKRKIKSSVFIGILMTIAFFLSLTNLFIGINSADITTNFSQRTYIFELFQVLACLYIVFRTKETQSFGSGFIKFIKINYLPVTQVSILVLLFLNYGDRGPAISFALLILGSIAFLYANISLKIVLLLSIIGTFALFSIRTVRKIDSISNLGVAQTTEIAMTQIGNNFFILPFADLIGISQELCIGYDIKEKQGLQNPEFLFIVPFYAIPGAPTYLSELIFQKSYSELSNFNTLNEYMGHNATYGKHCVSDIYMRWGIIGVCILFLFFGIFVGKIENDKYTSILAMCIFLLLFCQSLYLPRSSLINVIRPVSEAWFISLFFISKSRHIHNRMNV